MTKEINKINGLAHVRGVCGAFIAKCNRRFYGAFTLGISDPRLSQNLPITSAGRHRFLCYAAPHKENPEIGQQAFEAGMLATSPFHLLSLLRDTAMSFSIESKLGDLLDNETTKAILEKHLPGISTHPQIAMGKGFALSMVAKFSGGLITDDLLAKVDTELKTLS
ncbi:hypothetical protein [Aquabacterium sp.]|uniref:hypothetical protein n=1 Tax=Aquabacterium sp. TaxID=1872578 RepID=UPI00199775E8|nr:hypothetical protein [Aquabacterium sp.]MBC7700494.1 hypothetical protein [Aquabacterium sp.]